MRDSRSGRGRSRAGGGFGEPAAGEVAGEDTGELGQCPVDDGRSVATGRTPEPGLGVGWDVGHDRPHGRHVLAVGLPRPRQRGAESGERDVLDEREGLAPSRRPAGIGASDSEQLPITTVVTPCWGMGSRAGSQNSEASKCVWLSTKPGARTPPSRSSCASPSGRRSRPTSTMVPPRTRTSRGAAGAPVPSTTRPPVSNRSPPMSRPSRAQGTRTVERPSERPGASVANAHYR